MKDIYDEENRDKFDRDLYGEDSSKHLQELAERCLLGRKLMNHNKTIGAIMATLGFGGAPFVYQMWEAEQAGAGVPFAVMVGLVGFVGSYITYDSIKNVRELRRRKELTLKKASELEQRI